MSELAKMLETARAAYARAVPAPREVVVSQEWYDRLRAANEEHIHLLPFGGPGVEVGSITGIPVRIETPEEQADRMAHSYYGPVYVIHPDGIEADPRRFGCTEEGCPCGANGSRDDG